MPGTKPPAISWSPGSDPPPNTVTRLSWVDIECRPEVTAEFHDPFGELVACRQKEERQVVRDAFKMNDL